MQCHAIVVLDTKGTTYVHTPATQIQMNQRKSTTQRKKRSKKEQNKYPTNNDTKKVRRKKEKNKYPTSNDTKKCNNQKRVYPVRLESKTGTAWNQVKNTLDEPRDWPKTNRTRFSEIMTRVHL